MATVSNQYDPNDPNAQNQSGGSGTVLNSTGGGGATGVASGGSAPLSATQTPQSSTPSGTPNINQYLQANQGAGQRLSTGIQSNVQNQANQIGQGVQSASNQLNAQYQPLQQNLGANAQQTTQQAFQNPQALLDAYNAQKTSSSSAPLSQDQQNSANQYSQFQKLNTGGYGQDIQNYGTTAQNAQNNLSNQQAALQQRAGMAANESGRNQLLQQTVGQPGYNVGQQTLDSLFLQAQPGVANQLQQNLGNIAGQTGQQVSGLASDAQQRLAALKGLSGQDQQAIQNLFTNGSAQGTGLNQIASNVGNEYAQAQQNSTAANAGLQAAFQSNQFTPQQLQQLGLTQGQQTWGVDLSQAGNYHANPLADATQGGNAQVATPEEFARYNALNQLAGGPNGLQASIFGGASSAGGYNPYSYDTNALNSAIDAKKATDINDLTQYAKSFGTNGMDPAEEAKMLSTIGSGNFDQANQEVQQVYAKLLAQKHEVESYGGSYDLNGANFNNWNKYYRNTFSPAAAAQIGVASPESSPLPVNPTTGAIDYSQIQAPTGAAGKGDNTPLDPTKYLQGK